MDNIPRLVILKLFSYMIKNLRLNEVQTDTENLNTFQANVSLRKVIAVCQGFLILI